MYSMKSLIEIVKFDQYIFIPYLLILNVQLNIYKLFKFNVISHSLLKRSCKFEINILKKVKIK